MGRGKRREKKGEVKKGRGQGGEVRKREGVAEGVERVLRGCRWRGVREEVRLSSGWSTVVLSSTTTDWSG